MSRTTYLIAKPHLTVEIDDAVEAAFIDLAEHIGMDTGAALTEAMEEWVAHNAPLFGFRVLANFPTGEMAEEPAPDTNPFEPDASETPEPINRRLQLWLYLVASLSIVDAAFHIYRYLNT